MVNASMMNDGKYDVKLSTERIAPNFMKVYLQINSGERKYVGEIDNSGEGTLHLSNWPVEVIGGFDSIGFSYSVLTDNSLPYKWITVEDYGGNSTDKLVSTRDFCIAKGKCLPLPGWDLQVFVPVSELTIGNARMFEAGSGIESLLMAIWRTGKVIH